MSTESQRARWRRQAALHRARLTPEQREAEKLWFRNHNRTSAARMDYVRKGRDLINQIKDRPCMDCGLEYPSVAMQFDHRDPSTKRRTVGEMSRDSDAAILSEAEKCDVVCANCHAIRTHILYVEEVAS